MSTIVRLFNDFQNEKLLCYPWFYFPYYRMSSNTHWFNDVIVFHKLPASLLIVISNCRYWSAVIACITPIGDTITKFRASKLASIFIIKHLFYNDLKILLGNLVFRFEVILASVSCVFHHYRLVNISVWSGDNSHKFIIILGNINKSMPAWLSMNLLFYYVSWIKNQALANIIPVINVCIHPCNWY